MALNLSMLCLSVLCLSHDHINHSCLIKGKIARAYVLPHEAKLILSFGMSYLEVFGVLAGVGVDVLKFCEVGARVLNYEAGMEVTSEKCDSAHLYKTPGAQN